MKNIPNRIYLNIGCDPKGVKDFNDLSEVTWCADKVGDGDIEYTRKPIWHDLRKNPDDFPEINVPVLVKCISYVGNRECNDVASYIFNQEEQCYEFRFPFLGNYKDIIAWMEIPEFK